LPATVDFDGSRLRELRERAGLRREHVAVELNLSASAISAYEHGRAKPPTGKLGKIAALLGCEIEDLFR
jgi:transcriptional regulator with XRE-family HTH domain